MADKRGRPLALDELKCEIAIALLSVGCSLKTAASYLGIHTKSLQRHAKRDPKFAKRILKAQASLEWDHLKKVQEASGKSWRASAWMLERINPERFGKRKADSLTRSELEEAIGVLAYIITEEVHDHEAQVRIFSRLQRLLESIILQSN